MLNISGIHEGYVLDHIQAGMSMKIYDYLKLGQLDHCTTAMIMNAKSKKMGYKDIIKIECPIDAIALVISITTLRSISSTTMKSWRSAPCPFRRK